MGGKRYPVVPTNLGQTTVTLTVCQPCACEPQPIVQLLPGSSSNLK